MNTLCHPLLSQIDDTGSAACVVPSSGLTLALDAVDTSHSTSSYSCNGHDAHDIAYGAPLFPLPGVIKKDLVISRVVFHNVFYS